MMTKNEMESFRDMSGEAYRLHSGGNAVLASVLAGGLLLMAVAASIAGRGPHVDASNGVRPSEISATKRSGTGDVSAFMMMSTASHELPVRPHDEPAF